MTGRPVRATSGMLLALALLTACAPEPAPTPTPTGFASEEEAFAAAEETYRGYIEALNASRDHLENSPSPDTFLTGAALTQSLQVSEQLRESGLRISGPARILTLDPLEWDSSYATITTCMSYEEARVVDETGKDVTPPDRMDVASLEVQVIYAQPQPLIVRSSTDGTTC